MSGYLSRNPPLVCRTGRWLTLKAVASRGPRPPFYERTTEGLGSAMLVDEVKPVTSHTVIDRAPQVVMHCDVPFLLTHHLL